MSITSLGGGSANSLLLQQMLASLSTNALDPTDGPSSAESADSTGQPAAISLAPAPPPADGQPSALFSSDTLGALTASQVAGSSTTSGSSLLDEASSDLASDVMGVADTNGNGSLSLSKVESALGSNATSKTDATATDAASTGTTGASGSLASAFSALDTNGDGDLSLSELTAGLEQAIGQSASPPPPGPPPGGGAEATPTASSTPDGACDTGSGTTAAATTTTASTDGSTSTTDPTSSQQIVSMLASLMLQYANASYSSQAQAATETTTAATSITA